jgi:hypothetical protein
VKRIQKIVAYVAMVLGFLSACIDPYDPTVLTGNPEFLVVEGNIAMEGYSAFRLSYSRGLNDTLPARFATNAIVLIERDDQMSYPCVNKGNGAYASYDILHDTSRMYRLKIAVSGKNYISSFVPVRNAPPVDSIEWEVLPGVGGVQLYINTHDVLNKTRYYRWEYEETWKFHTAFRSNFYYKGGQLIARNPKDTSDPEHDIYFCWNSEISKKITLANTLELTEDIIYRLPLKFIDTTTLRLQYRYSILVKQFALTPEEYQYWDNLRKTSERMGSLFDPMPDNIRGNLSCVEAPNEPVMGYIGAGQIAEKRLYINSLELPIYYGMESFKDCLESRLSFISDPDWLFYIALPAYVPTDKYKNAFPVDSGIYFSKKKCVDCRLNGTNKKPDFWVDIY